jgi:predicted DNA-binding protein
MAKTERLQIRITPELKAQLQKLAEAEGRTVSNYIEQLIKTSINNTAKE